MEVTASNKIKRVGSMLLVCMKLMSLIHMYNCINCVNLIGIIVSNCINCVETFLCWLLSSAESDNFFLLLLRLILINFFVMVLGVTRLRGNFVIFLKTVPSYLVAYALFFIRIFIFPTYEGYSFIYFNVYNLYKFKISFSKINMTLYIYIFINKNLKKTLKKSWATARHRTIWNIHLRVMFVIINY